MSRYNNQPTVGSALFKQAHDRVTVFAIEISGGLIRDQDWRIIGQRSGNGNALLLTAGKFGRDFVLMSFDPHLIEQCQRPRPALVFRDGFDKVHSQHDIFENCQGGDKLEELEHNANFLTAKLGKLTFRQLADGCSGNTHMTAARMIDPA